jgi:hypothetical protein
MVEAFLVREGCRLFNKKHCRYASFIAVQRPLTKLSEVRPALIALRFSSTLRSWPQDGRGASGPVHPYEHHDHFIRNRFP